MNTISYTVSVSDLEALVDHELRTTYRRQLLTQSAVSAAILGGMAYAFLYLQLRHHVAALSVASVLFLLLLYSFPGVTRDQQRKGIRRLYARETDTALGPQSLSLDSEGLLVRSQTAESRILWSAFHRLSITADHAFLFLGPLKALIIPLSQLQEPSRQQLLAAFKLRVPPTIPPRAAA